MTIASANYLPYVKTLMQSIKETNPSYRRVFILVDKKTSELSDIELFETIEADKLDIKRFPDMAIRYDVMELNTAVKPFAIEWLFEHTDAPSVLYLDPDIRVYRRLTELEALLDDGASVVVTPHLTKPVEDGKQPNDHHMLQAGVFNLGVIAVRRAQEAREFVKWWGRRLETEGYSDVARNLFTDQRWVDLAPCFLERLAVLRSHAYNVAYWNLMQRPVSPKNGKLVYKDGPLAFYHFSGLDRNKPKVVSKHQNRLSWKDVEPYHELFVSYRSALKANGWHNRGNSPYAYDEVGSLKIASVVRGLYRELHPKAPADRFIDDRFLLTMCNAPAALPLNDEGRITRLMFWLYRQRPDLQLAFPLNTPEGVQAYRRWFEVSTPREYGLDERLANPPSTTAHPPALAGTIGAIAPSVPNLGRSFAYRKWRKFRKWLIERL